VCFDHLPRQRKLSDESRIEAELLLGMKANKKMVQKHLQAKTGKYILLRDLSNITAKSRKPVENQLEAAVSILRLEENTTVNVVVSEEGSELLGIFYQDQFMKQVFDDFPELFLIDATYKLNNLRMPLYVMMVVDGNGESEIVGTFLAADETESTVRMMIQVFKVNNPGHTKVKAIMSDKDFVERLVLHDELPQASMLICLFHVLRTFRREVTCEKMNIRAAQRDFCLDILQKIVYSRTSADYDANVTVLEESGVQSVIDYYRANWHNIKEQFVECFKGQNVTLGTRTNNRLECINQKIKSVCSK
jgi:zinc finger SWIM domain-containing protein 3